MERKNTWHAVKILVLMTVSAYFLADIVDVVIGKSLDAASRFERPENHNRSELLSSRGFSDYASILKSGYFGEGGNSSSSSGAVLSASFKLIGIAEGSGFAGAVLDDGKGQQFYRLKEKLPDGTVLARVMRRKVELLRPDGTTVDVEIAEDEKIVAMQKNNSGSVRRLAGNKFVVDQREVAENTENLSRILTQARAIPHMVQGKTVGFKITEIVPGSIYNKIGLQNGDIIQRVNSQELTDPGKFFQLYQGLRDERSITVDLVRGGQRQTLNYDIR